MKNTLTIFLLSILAFSCSKNDFENTNLYLEFDKETYQPNDNFELTIRIVPIEAEKTIRIYKDLNNIEISFLSKAEQNGFHQELKKRFIEGPSLTGDDSEYIDEFTISKEKPFEKKLLGTISESENQIIFEISDLKIKDKIDKTYLLDNPSILIKGNCRTVYGIEGEPFEPIEIKVVVE
ncbi:hypothetical protein [Winogradskyella wichelsiae]|uniref:hypothetical protein n=1 Tax=Winogradskyella wichelsiae TaxID=2697007 RepID=UPI0015C8FDD7|nr:hypothetical protein [Winogradskyella wichelsiae]